jgi:DnaJ-class molecular chaperone
MLEIKDVESDARDMIDALRDMSDSFDVRNDVRFKHGVEIRTCECCNGTGVEAITRESLIWPQGQGWTNPPATCQSCNGEGNYVINDQRNPTLTGDAGWD